MQAQASIIVNEHDSTQSKVGGIIVSAATTSSLEAKLVIGRPGFPNLESMLRVGGAVLFETLDGLFEIRVMSTNSSYVRLLITHLSPRPGIAAGLIDTDQSNALFSAEELRRIASSLDQIRLTMSSRSDVTPEQLEFISRKLDEMRSASERLGRKDWLSLAIGTLTSIIVTAALETTTARALLEAASAGLSWLLGSGIRLLS
jgi:hypothetical protein